MGYSQSQLNPSRSNVCIQWIQILRCTIVLLHTFNIVLSVDYVLF